MCCHVTTCGHASRGPTLQILLTWFQIFCGIFAWFQDSWLDSSDFCLPNLELCVMWLIIYRELQSFTRILMKVIQNLASHWCNLELYQTHRPLIDLIWYLMCALLIIYHLQIMMLFILCWILLFHWNLLVKECSIITRELICLYFWRPYLMFHGI